MKAMILAAGEGSRLRPLTLETPKVLLPVGGVPLIELTLRWLKSHGINEVGINLYDLGAKIRDFLGDGSRFGIKITYSAEETLLGTAGGVKRLENFFGATFVAVYGDVLTDFDLGEMMAYHLKTRAVATIALVTVPNPQEKGVVDIDERGRVLSFVEKPPRGTERGNLANGGVYILEPEILRYIPASGYVDFAFDIFPFLLEQGIPLNSYRLKREDYLVDIGTFENYRKANEDVIAGKVKISYGEQSRVP
jgi:NDP-sugar pyrophosphorylase family protein